MENDDRLNEMRESMKEDFGAWKQEVRESRFGLLKIIALESIPIAAGAALGGIGRATGENWIPAVPPALDIFGGGTIFMTFRGGWTYLKYGIGVALPYADKIYQIANGGLG